MFLRRILLFVMLVMLVGSAAAGALSLFVSSMDLAQILAISISTSAIAALMLPLTLLVDHPRFRVGGIACIVVLLLSLPCAVGMGFSLSAGGYLFAKISFEALFFTLLCGIPAAGALLLISFRWARFAAWTAAAVAAVAYPVCIAGVVGQFYGRFSGFWDIWPERLIRSGLATYGLGFLIALLLVNAGCGDKRLFRWPAMGCAAASILIFLPVIWDALPYESWGRMGAFLAILAAAGAHINLILMARLRGYQEWVKWGTLVCTLGAAALFLLLTLSQSWEFSEQVARLATVPSILTLVGSVILIIVAAFNRKTSLHPQGATTAMNDIQLTCPRCGSAQTLPVGESICRACELQISIKITEPRCPGCGYLLYQLTSRNCPECGALVRPNSPEIPSPALDFPVQPSPPQPVNP